MVRSAHQFGGSADQKIGRRKFYELLQICQNKDIFEQHNFLQQYFTKWKVNSEQTDDVTVLGVIVS